MKSSKKLSIRRGISESPDPARAAKELYEMIAQPEIAIAIFFCDPEYDRNILARELGRHFKGINLIGCTTAGEITPNGYRRGSLTGVSIGREGFRAAVGRIENLNQFRLREAEKLVQTLLSDLKEKGRTPTEANTFGFLLIDGLSLQEEAVVSALYRSLDNVSLIGGSAGDGEHFQNTGVYYQGEFRNDTALFTLMCTPFPFEVFKTEHFISGSEKMVVTEADCSRRIVTEINGLPAGREYARLVGLEVDKLSPMIFSTYPVVVKIGGDYYVRSIQKVNEDESLTFFCAIDEGIVLTVARGIDMIDNLEDVFQRVREKIGQPQIVLGCDCILRHLELDQKGIKERASNIFVDNQVIGFSTYGEQFNAMHVNQTLTGVAIGSKG